MDYSEVTPLIDFMETLKGKTLTTKRQVGFNSNNNDYSKDIITIPEGTEITVTEKVGFVPLKDTAIGGKGLTPETTWSIEVTGPFSEKYSKEGVLFSHKYADWVEFFNECFDVLGDNS